MTDRALCDTKNSEDCPHENGDRRSHKWHVDRTVGVDVILAFLLLLVTGIGYVVAHSKWEGHVDDTLSYLNEADKRHESNLNTQNEQILKRLDKFEEKLDKAIQRSNR